MAMVVRVSSGFTARPEQPVPSLLPPSASRTLAIKFSHPHLGFSHKLQLRSPNVTSKSRGVSPTKPRVMASGVREVLPPPLTSSSVPPSLFDGTTRLYISYACPYAQRVWITRNCKGLQEKMQLVPINLQDRPAWYKEKVYPPNKVPSLEHNNEVRGESLDLMKYIDIHFEGPSLFPDVLLTHARLSSLRYYAKLDDPAKRKFAEDLLSYTDTFYKTVTSSFKGDIDLTGADSAFNYIETALSKYEGAFFLGQFSLVDIAYAPFIERFRPFLIDVKNYDVATSRPKLASWIEAMNNIDAYKQTCCDTKELVDRYKKRFLFNNGT